MASRWNKDKPLSRSQLDREFRDDAACARFMAAERWPGGFECPACAGRKGWELKAKRFTWECAGCAKQTSVTAGTVMHGSRVPLRKWFELIHIMTSHSNGISAEQAQAQLGLGSWNTAWLMLHKLRRAMVVPDRAKLGGTVEVDETTIAFRTLKDPVGGGQGRRPIGKLAIACAVEISEDGLSKRIRLAPIPDFSRDTLHGFVAASVERGSTVVTDGLAAYKGLDDFVHVPKVVGTMAAHVLMKWVHRVFSNLKRWLMGTFHGARKAHLRRYLDEYVWRYNRRRWFSSGFTNLVAHAAALGHASRKQIVAQEA